MAVSAEPGAAEIVFIIVPRNKARHKPRAVCLLGGEIIRNKKAQRCVARVFLKLNDKPRKFLAFFFTI